MRVVFSKYRFTFVLLFFMSSNSSFAQFNLLPNPSFEIFDTCPINLGQLKYAIPWNNPLYGSTPDYFNSCNTQNFITSVPINIRGNQTPRTGSGYSFIVTYSLNPSNFREYLQVSLNDSLDIGIEYCIRFYVSAADTFNYTTNNIGVYFSKIKINDTIPGNPQNLPFLPQFENPNSNNLTDRIGWTEISGSYISTGGEKFILIGNFRDSSNTMASYTGWGNQNYGGYYIDDVLLSPCDSILNIHNYQDLNERINLINVNKELKIQSNGGMINSINITTITGQQIFNLKNINQGIISINMRQWLNGIYIVSISFKGNTINKKILLN